MRREGKLLVLEGPDGVGKSTLANKLVELLHVSGVDSLYASFPGHETGSLGKLVHEVHHDSAKFGVSSIDPTSLQLLHIAAHIDAIEQRLMPMLREGHWVVLDRFWWSTWVYGITSGANPTTLGKMIDLELEHWRGVRPALVFLLLAVEPGSEKLQPQQFAELSAAYRDLATKQVDSLQTIVFESNRPIADAWPELARVVGAMVTDSQEGR